MPLGIEQRVEILEAQAVSLQEQINAIVSSPLAISTVQLSSSDRSPIPGVDLECTSISFATAFESHVEVPFFRAVWQSPPEIPGEVEIRIFSGDDGGNAPLKMLRQTNELTRGGQLGRFAADSLDLFTLEPIWRMPAGSHRIAIIARSSQSGFIVTPTAYIRIVPVMPGG